MSEFRSTWGRVNRVGVTSEFIAIVSAVDEVPGDQSDRVVGVEN